MYKTTSLLALAVLAVSLAATSAEAALVQADFNDLSLGDLKGQAGGTGLAGSWTTANNSGNVDVVAGDLTAPAGTGFAVTQSGNPLSVLGAGGNNADRGLRDLSTPLSGDVWFSFLVDPTANGRGGIDLDAARIIAIGTQFGMLGPGFDVRINNSFTAGSDSLVLGRVQIDAGGAGEDFLEGWVNPSNVFNLGTPTISITDKNWIGDGQLNQLGIETYPGGAGAATTVDLVTLSDGGGNPNWAFEQAVGVPEPTTLLIWSLLAGLGVGLGWRRRK